MEGKRLHPGRPIDYSTAGREIDYFLNTWLGKGIDYFSTQPAGREIVCINASIKDVHAEGSPPPFVDAAEAPPPSDSPLKRFR